MCPSKNEVSLGEIIYKNLSHQSSEILREEVARGMRYLAMDTTLKWFVYADRPVVSDSWWVRGDIYAKDPYKEEPVGFYWGRHLGDHMDSELARVTQATPEGYTETLAYLVVSVGERLIDEVVYL